LKIILTVLLILFFLKAEEMFVALKASVVEMIQQSSWPDTITKQKALSKARNLRPNVVAPSIFFNQTFLESMAAQVLHHLHYYHVAGLDLYLYTYTALISNSQRSILMDWISWRVPGKCTDSSVVNFSTFISNR
jgi:hypothetical protein